MSEPNNITKLLAGLLTPVQDCENAFQQLLTMRSIDTAEGAQLDVIGKLVGQGRAGMNDDMYRRMVRARISVNRSKGTARDLITVSLLVVDDDDATVVVNNQGNAAVVLRIEDTPLPDDVAAILIRMLRDTVAAGVRVILEWSPEPVGNWLILDQGNFDEHLMLGATD